MNNHLFWTRCETLCCCFADISPHCGLSAIWSLSSQEDIKEGVGKNIFAEKSVISSKIVGGHWMVWELSQNESLSPANCRDIHLFAKHSGAALERGEENIIAIFPKVGQHKYCHFFSSICDNVTDWLTDQLCQGFEREIVDISGNWEPPNITIIVTLVNSIHNSCDVLCMTWGGWRGFSAI